MHGPIMQTHHEHLQRRDLWGMPRSCCTASMVSPASCGHVASCCQVHHSGSRFPQARRPSGFRAVGPTGGAGLQEGGRRAGALPGQLPRLNLPHSPPFLQDHPLFLTPHGLVLASLQGSSHVPRHCRLFRLLRDSPLY